MTEDPAIEAFIARWSRTTGSELANYQLFLTELTTLLDLPPPDPAADDNARNAYVFERRVLFHHPDGSSSAGRIDLYRRACFVCEAKQSGLSLRSTAWDGAMMKAHAQASNYARALPSREGRPPFIVVTDVGRHLGLYSDFTRSGANYIPFPDALSHRIYLKDLRQPALRERLRAVWLDPMSLDPARRSARVTRDISVKLATLARSLEADGHAPERVAAFLMRCLFTMFAEDVGLLPALCFSALLAQMRTDPDHLPHLLASLWADMNSGSAFSPVLRVPIPHFNGGLFADPGALPLSQAQIDLLIDAAGADWKEVEPAIFGTLLERALDPIERHKLGAHYTPRAYVERLVLPTVVEPLRAEWANVQASAYRLDEDGKRDQATEQVRAFHRRLCMVRVLDPACGSGNFLYVTLEHLKRLEGEVLEALADLGFTQQLLELEGGTVSPEQMLGLETNPRAALIAEAVLWIGYLQWHFRTFASTPPREPLLKDAHNIQCRDAVLAWDAVEYLTDERGIPVTRWDGRTFKTHPVTGERVPDEQARLPVERYRNPRPARWPEADFVVGNPPFIGAGPMRRALGDGYVEALRETYAQIPESADYVMHWWYKAAELTRAGELRRFGLITTNSLRQTFNRRVVQQQMQQKAPLSLAFAIPDHPWVDTADGAAVRIAMTVGQPGAGAGVLREVVAERGGSGEGVEVQLREREGVIFPDLRVGADVAGAVALAANAGISNRGVQLFGAGFIVTREQAEALGLGRIEGLAAHIREYRNGRDLTATPRGVMVIELLGLDAEQVRQRYPEVYQWVRERVKPERDQNRRASYRNKWWIFGEPRKDLRPALKGLARYISTVETSKHRFFTFLDASILPDNKLINIAIDDSRVLGVLSSRVHIAWAMRSGSWLGVGNDSVYAKTRCFEPFPFPLSPEGARQSSPGQGPGSAAVEGEALKGRDEEMDPGLPPDREPVAALPAEEVGVFAHIRTLAEQIDAHRKRQQALHPGLTLTGIYNLLERVRQLTATASCGSGAPAAMDGAEASGTAHRREGAPPTALASSSALASAGPPALTAKERQIHEQGLVSVLAQLHDELDTAVLRAYGWEDLIPALVGKPGGTTPLADKPAPLAAAEEELLTRLVALNAERAGEEARGLVRWLRPDFQHPADARAVQAGAEALTPEAREPVPAAKHPWPKTLPEQFQAVRALLAAQPAPASAEQIARQFKRAQTKRVAELLETLATLGQVQRPRAGLYSG